MKIVNTNNVAILCLIVIIVIYSFKLNSVKDKNFKLISEITKDYELYESNLKDIYTKNLKLQFKIDSILANPYDSIREVIKIKYEKDSVFISDANASELDSIIRSNW